MSAPVIERPNPFLSVQDVAELLGVCNLTVYRAVSSGKLPHYRFNRTIKFDLLEVLEHARSKK